MCRKGAPRVPAGRGKWRGTHLSRVPCGVARCFSHLRCLSRGARSGGGALSLSQTGTCVDNDKDSKWSGKKLAEDKIGVCASSTSLH